MYILNKKDKKESMKFMDQNICIKLLPLFRHFCNVIDICRRKNQKTENKRKQLTTSQNNILKVLYYIE